MPGPFRKVSSKPLAVAAALLASGRLRVRPCDDDVEEDPRFHSSRCSEAASAVDTSVEVSIDEFERESSEDDDYHHDFASPKFHSNMCSSTLEDESTFIDDLTASSGGSRSRDREERDESFSSSQAPGDGKQGFVECGRNSGMVLINVYDLYAFVGLNDIMDTSHFGIPPVGGALHAGVEVYGREWSYGGGCGISCEEPRTNRQHRFRETIVLGRTDLTAAEVASVISAMLGTWLPEDYHWLHRNCLAFANEFSERLGVGRLPAWIDRLPRATGALDMGIKNIADGVQEFAESARNIVQVIARGPGACGSCRVKPTGDGGRWCDSSFWKRPTEEVVVPSQNVWKQRVFQGETEDGDAETIDIDLKMPCSSQGLAEEQVEFFEDRAFLPTAWGCA